MARREDRSKSNIGRAADLAHMSVSPQVYTIQDDQETPELVDSETESGDEDIM